MASPLILKPLALANGQAVAMIALLQSTQVMNVCLNGVDGHAQQLSESAIRSPSLAEYPNSPLGPSASGKPPRSAAGSAIEAFISFAEKENGYVEVT
jgi:hypothetical protein